MQFRERCLGYGDLSARCKDILWGSCGYFFPTTLQHYDCPLVFHFGLQESIVLAFCNGAFGNDHMNDLSSQKVGVAALDWSLRTRLLFLSLSLCHTTMLLV